MTLDISTLIGAAQDHALATGLFDSVNGHEPLSPPGSGLTAAVWPQQIAPARGASGLASTTARVAMIFRIYSPMNQLPADAIDPAMVGAIDVMGSAYSGDFTLGGLVKQVDLLGAYGDPLGGQAGYLTEGAQQYRVWDITLPLVVNDLWPQAS